jgi:hypothetical protein
MRHNLRTRALAATAVAAATLVGAPALAQTVYSGGGAAATTAAADFAAAIGVSTLEDFEGQTTGNLAPSWGYNGGTATLNNGFGVTASYPYGGGAVSGTQGYGGYPEGLIGGSPLFSFTSALRAFGAYFVDMELQNSLIFTLSGGGSQTYALPVGGEGNVAFFGVDFGANTITGVTLSLQPQDAVLIDDVRLASVGAVVPEPTTWALLIAGFGLTGATLRRRRQATLPA